MPVQHTLFGSIPALLLLPFFLLQLFDHVAEAEITLRNTGKVGFQFSALLGEKDVCEDPRPGHPLVIPKMVRQPTAQGIPPFRYQSFSVTTYTLYVFYVTLCLSLITQRVTSRRMQSRSFQCTISLGSLRFSTRLSSCRWLSLSQRASLSEERASSPGCAWTYPESSVCAFGHCGGLSRYSKTVLLQCVTCYSCIV